MSKTMPPPPIIFFTSASILRSKLRELISSIIIFLSFSSFRLSGKQPVLIAVTVQQII